MNHEQLIYTITINCPYGSLCSRIESLSDEDVDAVYGIDGLNIVHLSESDMEQEIATWTQDDWYAVSDYLNECASARAQQRDAWRYQH